MCRNHDLLLIRQNFEVEVAGRGRRERMSLKASIVAKSHAISAETWAGNSAWHHGTALNVCATKGARILFFIKATPHSQSHVLSMGIS